MRYFCVFVYPFILNTCYDGNVHTYELKKKAFTVNRENIKQIFAIQMTFILAKKLQK